VVPDVLNYVWTDPRSGEKIDNKERGMGAALATFTFLVEMFNPNIEPAVWGNLRSNFEFIFQIDCYDDRKQALRDLADKPRLRYSKLHKKFQEDYENDFISSARNHLSVAIKLFEDLPL